MSDVMAWDAYERISDDPEDKRSGIGRQREDTESAVKARGGTVAVHHVENNTSAYKKKRVRLTDPLGNDYDGYRVIRPVWAEALRRLRTGEASRLMVWDLDRLARDPRDLEDAIEVVEHYGAEIRSATASEIDLSTESGRMSARLMVLMANKSSADTGRRVKRQKQSRLDSGMPLGSRWRTFGYTRQWEVIEAEADVVREVFERVARGESVNAVTSDLIARDVRRVSGGPWRYQATARMLESRIYAGRLTYKGEDAGPSKVPALVSEAMYAACQHRERKAAWNTRTGLLSGIAVCSACNTSMNRDGDAYRCSPILGGCGNVRIKAEWLDNAAEAAVWFLMMWRRSEETRKGPGSGDETDADTAALVEQLDRKIAEVQEAHTSGALDLADVIPMLKALRADRAKALDAAEAAISAAHDETWKPWDEYASADLSAKRTMIRRHVTALMVDPISKPGRSTYDPDRFRVVTVYADASGTAREFTGHGCDRLRVARDMATEVSPAIFERIEFMWGDAPALVKGETQGVLETPGMGGSRTVTRIEGGYVAFDMG